METLFVARDEVMSLLELAREDKCPSFPPFFSLCFRYAIDLRILLFCLTRKVGSSTEAQVVICTEAPLFAKHGWSPPP